MSGGAEEEADMRASREVEVLERWSAEKERREALEKRNAALVRELRSARSSIESKDKSSSGASRYSHK